MTIAVYGAVYAGALVFVAACVARALRYARLPVHLRWELYPVPHEARARVRHGGSYFEDGQWWTRKRRASLAGDLRFMIPEMVLLKGLWEWNRKLWYRSFAFHFGLYLLAAAVGLLVATALATIARPAGTFGDTGFGSSAIFSAARAAYRITGAAGCLLAFGGALALLHRRLADPALRNYSAPADIANPAFFAVAIGLVAIGYVTAGPGFPGPLEFTRGFLRLDAAVPVPGLLAAGLVAGSALLAYIPLTHMSHFIAKYFTYHAIRWDDRPMASGTRLEHHIAACLAMRPTWTGRHLGADGTRTWADIALAHPAEEAKK